MYVYGACLLWIGEVCCVGDTMDVTCCVFCLNSEAWSCRCLCMEV